MIAWVLYALVVTAVVAAAARAFETLARFAGYRLRWIWFGALVLSAALAVSSAVDVARGEPASALVFDGVRESARVASGRTAVERAWSVLALVGRSLDAPMRAGTQALEAALSPLPARYALAAWLFLSLGIAFVFIGVARRFARMRATWPTGRISGVDVRVSPAIGPVALGILRPEIVVPRWLLDRCTEEQGLAVAHEREHLRARDPLLIALGWAVVIAAPWNLALWYMMSRLRLAIEVDCDARVLRRGASPRAYGILLIDVAHSASPLSLGALTLAGKSSHLHERIIMLRPESTPFRRLRAVAALPCAAAGLLVACQATAPVSRPIVHRQASTLRPAVTLAVPPAAPSVKHDTIVVRRKRSTVDALTQALQPESDSATVAPADSTSPPSAAAGTPTIFIDGVRATMGDVRAIDRTRIDTVEILKGAAAIRAYGDDAKNGIILITTKR